MEGARSKHQDDQRRWNNFFLGLHAEIDFGRCDYLVEEELKLAGDNNEQHAIWALLLC